MVPVMSTLPGRSSVAYRWPISWKGRIALLTSIGVAGVPSASLVAIAIILAAIGLPVEAIGVLMVFDRVLDMARTAVNIFGDACCATIVARLEGEATNVAGAPIGAVRPDDPVSD